uniref:Secreted protein n=1 Tax=Rhipicephalus zambeziensis TaxID=60191 RepID=A0A224Y6I2_9ACAR
MTMSTAGGHFKHGFVLRELAWLVYCTMRTVGASHDVSWPSTSAVVSFTNLECNLSLLKANVKQAHACTLLKKHSLLVRCSVEIKRLCSADVNARLIIR